MANNKLRKILATMLAVSVTMSHSGMLAAFAEGDAVVSENPPEVGTIENPITDVTENTFTDAEGNQIKEVITEKEWKEVEGDPSPVTEDGSKNNTVTEGQETTIEQTLTSEDGLHIEDSGSITGEETITETTVTQKTTQEDTTDKDVAEEEQIVTSEEDPELVKEEIDETGETVGEDIVNRSDSTPIDSSDAPDVTLELTPGGSDREEAVVPAEYDIDRIPNEVDEDIKDEDGNVIGHKKLTVEEIKDKDGNVIGYESTEIITSYGKKELVSSNEDTKEWTDVPEESGSVDSEPKTEKDEPIITIELPTKPEESESYDELSGETTKVAVEEEKDENGQVVGYTTIKEVYNAEGEWVKTEVETVYGTVITTQVEREITKTTNTDVDTRVVTRVYKEPYSKTTKTYMEKAENGSITVSGSMSAVEAGSGHGNTSTTSITQINEPTYNTVDWDRALKNYSDWDGTKPSNMGNYDYKHVGRALESIYRANTGSSGTITHQFKLVDENGNVHIVYCADIDTSVRSGFRYNMVNVSDASYYNDDEADKLIAIAKNGFWGTLSGEGSIEAVRAFLKSNKGNSGLSDEEIDKLTEGEALTATQAALWRYGASGEGAVDANDVVGTTVTSASGGSQQTDANAEKRIQALYDALIAYSQNAEKVAAEVNENPVLINKEHFATSSTITVGDKVENHEDNLDNNPDNDVFETTIGFTMAVIPGANDALTVHILGENNEIIATKRITGNLDNGVSKENISGGGVKYTIKGLQLAEGVDITLNLTGTQNLGTGVYLYSSEVKEELSSQTFIGIAQGTRTINLNVDLKFSVTDPAAKIESKYNENTRSYEDVRTYESKQTKVEKTVITTVVETTTETKVTERNWASEWLYEYDLTTYRDDDGGEKKEKFTNILDEEVPLTNIPDEAVPLTGAASMWNMIALISLGGLVVVNAAEKKNKK